MTRAWQDARTAAAYSGFVLVAWKENAEHHRLALASWELAEDHIYAHRESPSILQTSGTQLGARPDVMEG